MSSIMENVEKVLLTAEPETCWLGMEPSPAIGYSWFLFIAFMFYCQHHTCDAYFVPAINVFVDKMRSSSNPWLQRWGEEAVAGATICALGCNGPELFSNLIALYTGSDAGIGVVVGSEIFNLLIIVGASVVFAPTLPLQIERAPFTRDCSFYFVSIVLLYWALMDKAISFFEAKVLLAAALAYVLAVYFTTDIANMIVGKKDDVVAAATGGQKGKMHGVEVDVQEVLHSAMTDGKRPSHKMDLQPTDAGIYAKEMSKDVECDKPSTAATVGFQFLTPQDAMLGDMLRYKDLKEVTVQGEGVIELLFQHNVKSVTLKLTCKTAAERDELLESIKSRSLGRTHIHGYDPTIASTFEHAKHVFAHGTLGDKIGAIPHVAVDLMLKTTLFPVDVKDMRKEGRWPMCFVGAMTWLAVFSYGMLEIAEQIHCNINAIPNAFLGITVCAIGTSFPNAVASIIMAQQNKPAAAIANALGSNVQNVFLAMALPWVIYCLQQGVTTIPQNVAGINEGVAWMMGTLILVLIMVLVPPVCAMNKSYGFLLTLVYVGYLVQTSGEAFGFLPVLMN
eukprot:TRINITY_DN2071_c0_g1_i3.p1 TRINITY_DN2071_c0_g1~~TRINITY_DN2071_c0_g1_i3.p1  ORF type:complete len:562 (+),score=174.78 TRINITY_DN2071_c0_g1_i3:61-1746(+)